MKTKLILFAFTIALFTACTRSDPNGNTADLNYQPLATGNWWKYNVPTPGSTNQDQLNVGNDITLNGKVYKKMETTSTPFGFYSTSLNNNGLRKLNGKLLLSGNVGLDFGSTLPINFNVDDLIIFNQSATPNNQLGEVTGVITQNFQNYPLTINYSLKSTAMDNLATYTSNNVTYNDVKKVKITLNLKISTSVVIQGFTVNVPLLNTQDVVTSMQYYAKNIGVIYTKTDVSYQLQDFSQFGINLPIPQSGNETQEEFIDSYSVN